MPEPLLEIRGLQAQFAMARRLRDRLRREPAEYLRAVDGVDLTIERGETVGLVGESGCGKTTLARCVVGLVEPTAGSMRFDGKPLGQRQGAAARQIQMVFQDPYGSLNPRMTVRKALSELLIVHDMVPKAKREERLRELMALVDLPAGTLDAYPRQLSGGQRQRVCIARALALAPELIVADEPVSALDVSVQATILNLLQDLTTRLGLTTLFIAHDLSVVRRLCDEVAVMYLGRIVERGPTDVVFSHPRHPYTRALMAAVPRIGIPDRREDEAVHGDPPSPLHLPTGCRFRTRCPIAEDRCAEEEPELLGPTEEHEAACYLAWPDEPSEPPSLPRASRSARISAIRSSLTSSALSEELGQAENSRLVKPVSWADRAISSE